MKESPTHSSDGDARAPINQSSVADRAAPPAAASTYGQILRSSALIGGSSVVNVAIGIVRTKVMAVCLGTAGVGLLGLYGSVIDFAQAVGGMGVNSAGVRQIAEAVGSGDKRRIAQTAIVVRRVSLGLGILVAFLLVLLSRQVSTLTFGSDQNAAAVAFLSLAVCFRVISYGQGALIQGMRRIADMARMGVLGGLFGTVISIPLVYFFREDGVVPSLIAASAMSILVSWYYSRKVQVEATAMTTSEAGREAASLLKLGFTFMASGFMTMGAAYTIRILIVRKLGLEAAGLYQSAWTLGGFYIGLILQAMGSDFYPRLTAIAKDDAECNRVVNEQALVNLLLAGPGVLATLTLAPLVITLFYSAKFDAAVGILRWLCLGLTLRVIAWPIGTIVVARNEQMIFFWTEVAATVVHVGLAWLCIALMGLAGAGVAFFGLYVWHVFLIYGIVRRLSGFRWSRTNRQTQLLFLPLIGAVFGGFFFLPFWLATTLGMLAALLSGIYSTRILLSLVPLDRIPPAVRRILVRLGLARSGAREPT